MQTEFGKIKLNCIFYYIGIPFKKVSDFSAEFIDGKQKGVRRNFHPKDSILLVVGECN